MIWHVAAWIAGVFVAVLVIMGLLLMFLASCSDHDEGTP